MMFHAPRLFQYIFITVIRSYGCKVLRLVRITFKPHNLKAVHNFTTNEMKRYVTALTIAGSDPSGGAGMQADLKTFSALGVYGTTAITAVTVQNTQSVKYVHTLPPQVVYDQIVGVMEDLCVDAVKIGMVNDADTLDAIVRALSERKPKFLVVDPVMVSTSGCALMQPDALVIMKERLLPMADLVTPNLPEAWTLAGTDTSVDDAAQKILKLGVKALLIKGGHAEGKTKTDHLYMNNGGGVKRVEFTSETVETKNTHGTGCTLSSAIAAFAARGCGLEDAVRKAKAYLTGALKAGADVVVGKGHGPVCHFFKQASGQADKQTDCLQVVTDCNPSNLVCLSTRLSSAVNLQFITHFTEKYSYADSAMIALEGGCRWIQLRMKDADEAEIERVARLVLPECRRRGAVFVIDDHVDLALRVGADGVHLGKNDMPVSEARRLAGADFIIGGTANTFEDVQRLAAQGADYIGCGPFRFTTTKKKLAPMLGIEGYKRILSQMKGCGITLPLVAIGGITCGDIPQLMAAGVSGIALSGSVLRAENPVEEMKKVVEKLKIKS